MQQLANLITADNVLCQESAKSRKRVLQDVATLLAPTIGAQGVGEDELFDQLMARERLGSTGLGDGVAIPHCRVPCATMQVALVTLAQAIDYEASDGKNVDLLFFLIVPEDERVAHLNALAALAEVFSNPQQRTALRACNDKLSLQTSMQGFLNAISNSDNS